MSQRDPVSVIKTNSASANLSVFHPHFAADVDIGRKPRCTTNVASLDLSPDDHDRSPSPIVDASTHLSIFPLPIARQSGCSDLRRQPLESALARYIFWRRQGGNHPPNVRMAMADCLAAGLHGGSWLTLLIMFFAMSAVSAQGDITVVTSTQKDVPDWANPSALNMAITLQPGGKPSSSMYTVIPLTASVGLNGTGVIRGTINIMGHLKAANVSSYNDLSGGDTIAFLSCDKPTSDGFIDPDKMLSRLMKASLKAIILYTIDQNICLISNEDTLPYTSILSMADSGEAGGVLSYLNGTQPVTSADAQISGKAGQPSPNSGSGDGGGSNSAVAMSILYSITGIITLLFLVIIATGAIRAHRYPERYGPRGGLGGRPRQSRAKGLARAVLDTIPIVKFGNQEPAKPDPELELDGAMADGHETTSHRAVTNTGESEPPEAKTAAAAAAALADKKDKSGQSSSEQTSKAPDAASAHAENEGGDEHIGCSICTEDFTVGEDVRVLPCNHHFHPHCVDPWLVNVSGTCPLCRLDLRPGRQGPNDQSSFDPEENLAPPLVLEGDDVDSSHATHSNRLSRLLDVNRLRQAGVEERIAALRQMRAHSANHETREPETVEDRPQASRLTDKLKDKFRIRTRSQSANP
ncbi:Zinc finger, RING/FYVE/PHD-type, partial [Metarhizium majus ARSEF 297]